MEDLDSLKDDVRETQFPRVIVPVTIEILRYILEKKPS